MNKPFVTHAPFGNANGSPVTVYTLTNSSGTELRAIDYGGVILSLRVPDRNNQLGDVVLGFDSLAPYTTISPYFGALIGRYANRIANGRFTLDSHTYTLARNDGVNSLHGGNCGFNKVMWNAEPFQHSDRVGLALTRTSADGEEGYPGDLEATVTYTLTDSNDVIFEYGATTDKATPINLTQHSYFNLSARDTTILDHVAMINADSFTPVDSTQIPTGEITSVSNTPFDFRSPTRIGARIDEDNEQLKIGNGYDHNFVLRRAETSDTGNDATSGMTLAATVYDPVSGRAMEVHTTEPGLQFYTGNFLDGTLIGKGGVAYKRRSGFALETQHFPDSPNHPTFPATILRPGNAYRSKSVYRFSVRAAR